MKTVYKFKPASHWNYITEQQYDILVKFYGEDMLKTEQEEEMKPILNQQITDLQPEDNIEEIEVEDYHLYQSDDPNDVNPQEPWAW